MCPENRWPGSRPRQPLLWDHYSRNTFFVSYWKMQLKWHYSWRTRLMNRSSLRFIFRKQWADWAKENHLRAVWTLRLLKRVLRSEFSWSNLVTHRQSLVSSDGLSQVLQCSLYRDPKAAHQNELIGYLLSKVFTFLPKMILSVLARIPPDERKREL